MNVLIISSASIDIDNYYSNLAKQISNFLAENNCDLIFGGSHLSMMGICYQEFVKKGRKVYAFTTEKYVEQLENLKESISVVTKSTFDLKKIMFEKSDIIVCLAGGLGTLSELLSYIEEKRSNDKNKPIIIYDENKFYNHLILQLNKMEKEKFMSSEVKKNFEIVHNLEEFEEIFNKLKESVIK